MDRSTSGYNKSFHSPQYERFDNLDYDIYFQPLNIKKYLKKLIRIQNLENENFFPNEEEYIQIYFDKNFQNFNHNKIKYTNKTDLDLISIILTNIGKSGYEFIKSTLQLGYINKPVLLFYGIEHLSAFFLNLHYNFTQENSSLSSIMTNQYYSHGIDSNQFNRINISDNLSNLLNYKIKLTKQGFASRFFLSLGFPIKEFFILQKEISLIELIQTFFLTTRIGISPKMKSLMMEDLSPYLKKENELDYDEDIDLFVFYMLSFIFSHLSRYKMYTWQQLITSDDYNISFYLKFIINTINELYIRKIFSIIEYHNERMTTHLRKLEKNL
ncbi:MAG: hypothetical protein ACFFA3_17360 [Promethearchaeota archaeon]